MHNAPIQKTTILELGVYLSKLTMCIQSALDYDCQVWNLNAAQYLSEEIERIQKRALRLICPHLSSSQALEQTQLATLEQRHNNLSSSISRTQPNQDTKSIPFYNLKNSKYFDLLRCRSGRFKKNFIPQWQCISLFNNPEFVRFSNNYSLFYTINFTPAFLSPGKIHVMIKFLYMYIAFKLLQFSRTIQPFVANQILVPSGNKVNIVIKTENK